MKQSNKDLSKIFFNSVEEMNECYGIDAELPSELYAETEAVCYEIVEPFVFERVGQYSFSRNGLHYVNKLGERTISSHNETEIELEEHEFDLSEYEGRCFVYVRVNEYLRKHLEKTLIGCEFVYRNSKANTQSRRFVHSVEDRKLGMVVTDQDGLSGYLGEQLFYPDDYSDPIPYKEWVKKINEQDVEC